MQNSAFNLPGSNGNATNSPGTDNGIYYKNPNPTHRRVNTELSVAGMDDNIEVCAHDATDFGTSDFSISTWIKTSNNQELEVIRDERIENSESIQAYRFFNYFGRLGLQLFDGLGWANYISNISMADGQWHQVTVTIDRDNAQGGRWYLDGTLVGTFNLTRRKGLLRRLKITLALIIFLCRSTSLESYK